MIEITSFFKKTDIDDVLNCLVTLPQAIRPLYFSENENLSSTDNLVSKSEKFDHFKQQNSSGYFLLGDNCLYDFKIYSDEYFQVYLDLPDEFQEYISPFFEAIVLAQPVFAYAADEYEVKHRNRFYKTIGANNIEDWVGRDINKYIPGLYCYTLFSEQLIKKHSIDFSSLVPNAFSYIEFENNGRLHLLKFYENTSSWEKFAKELDELCYRTQGIFSIKSVSKVVEEIDNLLEYDDVIYDWR